MKGTKFETVDEYIATFPASTKAILKEIRKTIKLAAPKAEEVISYNMPAFRLQGALVYYAAYNRHIGLYPAASGMREFKDALEGYQVSKGTIRFPLDEPIPYGLIRRVVKFRVKENLTKARAKAKK